MNVKGASNQCPGICLIGEDLTGTAWNGAAVFQELSCMIRFLHLVFLFPMAVGTGFCANWYLDGAATGANNGTSWADAWNNPTNVVWTSINPGDTLYLSGGTTNQIYTNSLNMPSGKSGTVGNLITVSHSSDAGHNGKVIFDNCVLSPSSTSIYVLFTGAYSNNFVNPTNNQQVAFGSTCITNNIGIQIRNLVGTNLNDLSPVVWYLNGADNIRFSYIEVSGFTNIPSARPGFDWAGCVVYTAQPMDEQTNVVFEYLWFHDNTTAQFNGGTPHNQHFDDYTIKFCWIYNNSEDLIQNGSGWTIRDSVLGPAKSVGSKTHADGFQFTGAWIKIYNNVVYPSLNSISRLQTYPESVTHDWYFFNNIIPEIPSHQNNGGTYNEAQCFVHFDPVHSGTNAWYTNIIYANNTVYNSMTNTVQNVLSQGSWLNFSRGQLTNCFINSFLIANNIFADKNKGLSLPLVTNINPASGYCPFTTNDMIVDYNVLVATNLSLESPTRVNYLDYSGLSWGPYLRHNKTNYPAFTDKANGNFELLPTDTVALSSGTNLSSLFTFDNLNRPRRATGAWDIGALQLQETNLTVWLTFDDTNAFSDSKITDYSGNGNHAWRFGRAGSVYPTNFPSQILSSTTPGRSNLSPSDYCGRFDWYNTGYGLYGREGDYAAITNVSRLTNLATASIMCWARYYAPHAGLDYSSDANEQLLSAGTSTGILGTWGFGRDNENIWLNNTRFIVLTNGATFGKSVIEFRENGLQDDSTNWTHYAVTWINGVMIGYMNGVPFQTNDVSAIVTRLQVGANNNNPTPWIGVGTDTHGGTPPLGDESPQIEYPNNGWMNGVIDDVRIYNRTLSAGEIREVYSTGSTSPTGRPAPPTGLKVEP